MKRHESIAPLSRDHHNSLILAQLLKNNAPLYKGLPKSIGDKAIYAKQQFDEHIKKHFELEEKMLEIVNGVDSEIDSISKEIIIEHELITALFIALATSKDLGATMDTLGNSLEAHIRKEERVLFPLLQLHCSEEKLLQIHELIH